MCTRNKIKYIHNQGRVKGFGLLLYLTCTQACMFTSRVTTTTTKPFVPSIWGRLHEPKENYARLGTWISFLHSFLSSNMPLLRLRQCTVHCLSQVRIKEEDCGRPVIANVKHYHILWTCPLEILMNNKLHKYIAIT